MKKSLFLIVALVNISPKKIAYILGGNFIGFLTFSPNKFENFSLVIVKPVA